MNTDTNKRRPFLFDVDFGAAENQTEDIPEVEEEPAPPTFSEADLHAAKQDAYNLGHAAGNQESIAGFEHRIAESLDVATSAFSRLAATQEEANKQIALDGLRLAATVVEKMMPEMVRRHGVEEIESAVADVLENIIDEPTVTVTVHEDLMEPMAERLRPVALKSGLGDRLLVTSDPTLGLSDCRVSWGDGGAERNADAIWSRVEDTLDRNLALPPEESTPEPTPKPTADIPEVATTDGSPPPVERTNDAQSSEASPPPVSLPDSTPEPVIQSADVLAPSLNAAAPDIETEPHDMNTASVPDHNVEPAPQESTDPINSEPHTPDATAFEPITAAPRELPGAIALELPNSMPIGLPGAVSPGLPGAVQPVKDNPDTEGEQA